MRINIRACNRPQGRRGGWHNTTVQEALSCRASSPGRRLRRNAAAGLYAWEFPETNAVCCCGICVEAAFWSISRISGIAGNIIFSACDLHDQAVGEGIASAGSERGRGSIIPVDRVVRRASPHFTRAALLSALLTFRSLTRPRARALHAFLALPHASRLHTMLLSPLSFSRT